MKATDKKPATQQQVHIAPPVKETSGDKKFDNAIDLLLKKLPNPTPTK